MNNGNFVKFSMIAFLLAGVVLLSLDPESLPYFYLPRSMAMLSFLYAFLIFLPALIFRVPDGIDKLSLAKKKTALANLQAAVAVALATDGAGALGLYELYKVGVPYDKIAHFGVSAILILALANFILQWYAPNTMKAILISVILVMSGGVLWEIIEFSSDVFFNTKRFGIRGENIFSDTTLDLVMDALGTIGASFLVHKKHNNK